MSKLYVVSVQGTELVLVNGEREPHGQYFNASYIKVVDLETNKRINWTYGVFTQPKGQFHTDEEIDKLKEMGLKCFYIHPWDWSKNNKTAMEYIKKTTGIYREYEDENGDTISSVFDGWVIIGEVDKEAVVC